jgi:superfamily II DNA or RNA helicase
MYFLYVVSAEVHKVKSIVKIGITKNLYSRRSTYRTGCVPKLTPSHDIDYELIFETNATSEKELYKFEAIIHQQFQHYRLVRTVPGDSEWFDFKDKDAFQEIENFLSKQKFIKRKIPLDEIPREKESKFLRKLYYKNLDFEENYTKRNDLLNSFQIPIIKTIQEFINDSTREAGIVISPCGSGKTVMTCKSLQNCKKVIICVPSKPIQNQWKETLTKKLNIFREENILCIGSEGTTQKEIIEDFVQKEVFCLITTNASSIHLLNYINKCEIILIDEAHHLAGIVSKEDSGEGKTRKLMEKACEFKIKRLSLTYTPRLIRNDDSGNNYFSMDDEDIFGKVLINVNIRNLIQQGILPDYRIWTLHDETNKGQGILAKAECILEAWNAKEVVSSYENGNYISKEKFILDHLIIFTSDNVYDGEKMYKYLLDRITDTEIFHVKGGNNDLDEIKKNFSKAKRAILINCKVLGEGVDIADANAVAITYPKQSKGEITQMIFRAGRWKEDKPLFHLLLPIVGDEDMSGFEEVLTSLASCDSFIQDEIIYRSNSLKSDIQSPIPNEDGSIKPSLIMIDEIDSENIKDIRESFRNILHRTGISKNSKMIQKLCIEKNIDTNKEYKTIFLKEYPYFCEDPRPKNITWYDYLHPYVEKIKIQEFVNQVLEPNLLDSSEKYENWYSKEKKIPSLENITDGYFGENYTSFLDIYSKFSTKKIFSRR